MGNSAITDFEGVTLYRLSRYSGKKDNQRSARIRVDRNGLEFRQSCIRWSSQSVSAGASSNASFRHRRIVDLGKPVLPIQDMKRRDGGDEMDDKRRRRIGGKVVPP